MSLLVPASLLLAAATFAGASPTAIDEGIPFGLFGMRASRLVDPYTSGMQVGQPQTILKELAAARARGAHIFVNFAGANAGRITDPDGRFDFEKWKDRVNLFLPVRDQLNGYAADGTLVAFFMIDEPFARKRWGGQTVPLATLDQMAEYSKSIFPDLPTAVREAPSALRGYAWKYLDLSWAQYTARKGSVTDFAASEAAAARKAGLGLVVGLNITKGGDGSSGMAVNEDWSMSGQEILKYGHALLNEPDACAFVSWDSRPAVIERSDVAAALQELAAAAKAHPPTPCRRPSDRKSSS